MLDEVSRYLNQFGLYFLFIATVLENVPFVGLFLPGEVIVVAAGFFAARGDFDIGQIFIIATIGGILGNNIGYWLGRHGGRPLIEKLAERFHFDLKHVLAAEDYFDTHGSKTVFIGRFVAGLKAFVTTLAGAAHMNYLIFFVYSSAGIISWTLLALILGFFFGQYFDIVIAILETIGWVVPVLVLIVVFAIWIYRRRRHKKL